MRNLILQLSLFLSLLLQCCTDQSDYYTYLDHNFAVDYPNGWQVTHEIDGLKISPNDEYGVVTIANYPTTDRPVESMKGFILSLSKTNDSSQKVKVTRVQDATEYYYEYADSDFKRIIKLIRKDNNFHLLKLNCRLVEWEKRKHIFFHIVNSFHFRVDR